MKTRIMMTVSTVALLLAAPALAQSDPAARQSASNSPATHDMSTAGTKADATSDQIRAVVIDEANAAAAPSYLTIDKKTTANGIIGKPVYDTAGKEIAKVDDLIVDKSGHVTTAVLANGSFLGVGGKLAAFDYSLVTQRNDKGDIVIPISDDTVKKAVSYSYDTKTAGSNANTKTMPATDYRMTRILKANLIGPDSSKVASVDNASLQDGQIDYLIAGFDKTLGMGGKKAAIKYDAVSMATTSADHPDFQLSMNQENRLKNLSKMNLSSK
jgi:sporulation protein YlmC with PRC-barrel domain